jgi:hypothetical protein
MPELVIDRETGAAGVVNGFSLGTLWIFFERLRPDGTKWIGEEAYDRNDPRLEFLK